MVFVVVNNTSNLAVPNRKHNEKQKMFLWDVNRVDV